MNTRPDPSVRIIPRKEHRISRKQISRNALRTLYRLHERGFIAHLIGGCVRDLLLERAPKDFDIVTNATPGQIKRLFRNSFLIGRRFRLAHIHFQDEIIEVSTFRRDAVPSDSADRGETGPHNRPPHHIKNEDGMVLLDNLFGTPVEDALRRDFTINALAYNIADFSVIDYTSGLSDLQQRLIRIIGDPYERFTEDPVRMLRAVRFSASHDLVVEPVTWGVLCKLSSTISRVPSARIYEEIQKLFLLGHARPSFGLLDESGLLAALFPRLSQWLNSNRLHRTSLHAHLDWLDHLCQGGTPPSPALFLAVLFGPSLEEAAVARHRDGIPYQEALGAMCSIFMKEICTTTCVPRRVGGQLRHILALLPSLRRVPPRRSPSIVNRPEFAEAMAYFSLAAKEESEDGVRPIKLTNRKKRRRATYSRAREKKGEG